MLLELKNTDMVHESRIGQEMSTLSIGCLSDQEEENLEKEENLEQEERGYPEVCTYTIESEDDYDDYEAGCDFYIFKLNSFYFYL